MDIAKTFRPYLFVYIYIYITRRFPLVESKQINQYYYVYLLTVGGWVTFGATTGLVINPVPREEVG